MCVLSTSAGSSSTVNYQLSSYETDPDAKGAPALTSIDLRLLSYLFLPILSFLILILSNHNQSYILYLF